jgi:hypothetical protein
MLTTAEAAVYLKLAQVTLVRWRGEQIGPRYVKQGRYVRYRQADLDTWVDAHVVSGRYDHAAPRKRGPRPSPARLRPVE